MASSFHQMEDYWVALSPRFRFTLPNMNACYYACPNTAARFHCRDCVASQAQKPLLP